MIDHRFKKSGELFKKILTHMDSMSRSELMELHAESENASQSECSPALYHVIQALDDIAKAELINRDLMGIF